MAEWSFVVILLGVSPAAFGMSDAKADIDASFTFTFDTQAECEEFVEAPESTMPPPLDEYVAVVTLCKQESDNG